MRRSRGERFRAVAIAAFVAAFTAAVAAAVVFSPGASQAATQRPAPDVQGASAPGAPQTQETTPFAELVDRLSEPGGFFDTDNLISNERSYLHVVGALKRLREGGAYIGVGPDQNFSYLAAARPSVAFMLDIRRDNLLQHLWFKALFHLTTSRIEYLSMLTGRPPPPSLEGWRRRPMAELVAYIDRTELDEQWARDNGERIREAIQGFGIPLEEADFRTIERFHGEFMNAGLDLRFRSFGRAPRPTYPTLRDLYFETDRDGNLASYLAEEADFQFVRRMQVQNRVIPVVGDLAGSHALAAIGDYLDEQGEVVSAFYTSNVEFYLMGAGTFDDFIDNLDELPLTQRSLLVRSLFLNSFRRGHPDGVPGYATVQITQPIMDLVTEHREQIFRSYRELIQRPLRQGVPPGPPEDRTSSRSLR